MILHEEPVQRFLTVLNHAPRVIEIIKTKFGCPHIVFEWNQNATFLTYFNFKM